MERDTFFGQMFSFTNRHMPPEPRGTYQTTGLLLRIFGWIGLVILALMVVGIVIGMLAVAVFGAAFDAMVPNWWGDFGSGIAAIAVFAMLFAMVFVVLIGGALLYWLGLTYEQYRMQDPRALGNLLGIGIVAVVLGAMGLLGGLNSMSFQGGTDSLMVGGSNPLFALAQLGFGIAFLVLRSNPDVQAAFHSEAAAVPSATAEAE